MRRDIEDIITDIQTLVESNIQSYIDTVNTEKGNTELIDYETRALKVWEEFTHIPNFPVFYHLMPFPDIDSDSAEFGGTALRYRITFGIYVREQNKQNAVRLAHRYLGMLVRLFNDKIVKDINSYAEITDAFVLGLSVKDGSRLQRAAIEITTNVAY